MRGKIVGLLASIVIIAAAGEASAKCDQWGNCYNSYGGSGSASTYGSSSRTGSTWSSQTYGGTTRGYDSSGNSYSYSRQGGYQNYGTGERRSYDPYTGRRLR